MQYMSDLKVLLIECIHKVRDDKMELGKAKAICGLSSQLLKAVSVEIMINRTGALVPTKEIKLK